MGYRETLTVDELRNVDEDTYLVAKLHENEYWQQAEGRVSHVTEWDSGEVHVVIRGYHGHESRIKVPADGRERITLNGAAGGAKNSHVTEVIAVDKP